MPDARSVYEARIAVLSEQIAAIDRRYDRVAWSRLATLLVGVVVAVFTLWRGLGLWGWVVTATAGLAFVVLVVAHARIARLRDRAHAARAYNQRGIDRLDGKWPKFPRHGGVYLDDSHGYALDLDIFGPGSLFQLLNEARTAPGERVLASWLLEPADAESIGLRQGAARELAGNHALREALAVSGARVSESAPDIEPLLKWIEAGPVLKAGPLLRLFAFVTPATLIAALSLSGQPWVPSWLFLIPFALNVVVLSRISKRLSPAIEATTSRAEDLARYGEILELIEVQRFETPGLQALQARLRTTGAQASTEIAKLSTRVSILDARQNGAFRALIGPSLMWDVHCVAALEHWQARVNGAPRHWLEAVAELEALVSFATLSFEQPSYTFPTVTRADLHFEATGLGHPLIDATARVLNDVSLPAAGNVLLVTGSNMSGKSTLLRSVGLASVMGMAGAPVCAASLALGSCVVRTSMRVSDSVREGISRFYAELLKIRRVVSAADGGAPVLYLLDEILHGTNSRERHIGARSIIRTLASRNALGAVSTHDLALADLEGMLAGKLRTVHFQEQVVDGKMTFDYRLREGVVRSGNALRWMRLVGLEVEQDEA